MIHFTPAVIDDEQLSAYLDDRLPVEVRDRLEAVLAADPAQRAALEGLRYTRDLLAETPRLAVPRAFTLNEAMLGAQPSARRGAFWLQPVWLRTMAALAGMLLVVLLVGDIGARTQLWATQPDATRAVLGGLTADQGDPTAIIAKASTASAAVQPVFLGLAPGALLMLEIGLAVLVVALLLLARQRSRAP